MEQYNIIGYYVYDLNNDVALIRVDTGGREVPYMTIGDSEAMLVGEDVFALGSPLGMHLVFSSGNLSRLVTYGINVGRYRVYDTMQFTAPISGGNSGGPLFNNRGEVVGVNFAGVPGELGQNLNSAIRIERAMELTYNDHPLNPLPIGHGVPNFQINIVGSWVSDFGYTDFNDDGTGRRRWVIDLLEINDEGELTFGDGPLEWREFTWALSGGILSMNSICNNFSWTVDVQHPDVFTASSTTFVRTIASFFDITGTWLWDGGYYVFNADGTGTRDWSIAPGAFRWTLTDNVLTITSDGNVDEDWSFSASEVSADRIFIAGQEFFRDMSAFDLTGTWLWSGGYYIFNADGTGTRDWSSAPGAFRWALSEDILTVTSDGNADENWSFYVVDASTILIAEQEFVRDVVSFDLAGTWRWSGGTLLFAPNFYTFNPDGTGARDGYVEVTVGGGTGRLPATGEFSWALVNGVLIIATDGVDTVLDPNHGYGALPITGNQYERPRFIVVDTNTVVIGQSVFTRDS